VQTDRTKLKMKDRDAGLILLLTGRRRHDRFRADVDGAPVWLPHASFKALVKLVVARFRSNSGFATINRLTIHRLRKALGKRGKELIAIGSGEEYFLTIRKARAAEQVGGAPCFFELVERHFVSAEDAEVLREHCRQCNLGDDDDGFPAAVRKRRGNGKETKRKQSGNKAEIDIAGWPDHNLFQEKDGCHAKGVNCVALPGGRIPHVLANGRRARAGHEGGRQSTGCRIREAGEGSR
jgi:hypothetical protein